MRRLVLCMVAARLGRDSVVVRRAIRIKLIRFVRVERRRRLAVVARSVRPAPFTRRTGQLRMGRLALVLALFAAGCGRGTEEAPSAPEAGCPFVLDMTRLRGARGLSSEYMELKRIRTLVAVWVAEELQCGADR